MLPESSATLLESRRPLRRREYDHLVQLGAFDDERLELIDGVLVAMSPQGAEHAHLVSKLARILTTALGLRAEVRSHSPLAISDESEPEPDIAVAPPGDYAREHPKTALLVVEVADSSLRKDHALKTPLYAAAGIAEYWIVNLVDRVVEVHRAPDPKAERYTDVSTHAQGGEPLRVLAFPDVTVAVADLIR